MARFDNKVVLVSGGARGQGAAEARLLVAQGTVLHGGGSWLRVAGWRHTLAGPFPSLDPPYRGRN